MYISLALTRRTYDVCAGEPFILQNWRMVAGNLVSGGLAGGSATIISYPFELTRTRCAVVFACILLVLSKLIGLIYPILISSQTGCG